MFRSFSSLKMRFLKPTVVCLWLATLAFSAVPAGMLLNGRTVCPVDGSETFGASCCCAESLPDDCFDCNLPESEPENEHGHDNDSNACGCHFSTDPVSHYPFAAPLKEKQPGSGSGTLSFALLEIGNVSALGAESPSTLFGNGPPGISSRCLSRLYCRYLI